MRTLLLAVLCLAAILPPALGAGRPYGITVRAGPHDRHQSIVFFDLRPGSPQNYSLRDDSGKIYDVQVDTNGRACFVQNSLRRGDTKKYQLVDRQITQSGGERLVDIKPMVGGTIELNISGRPILHYHASKTPLPRDGIKPQFQRGGYIHPLFTPTGKVVTDDYATNHLHQHGVWFAWTKTQFEGREPDFWNMGSGKGTVEPLSAQDSWAGPVHAGFRSHHGHIDLTTPERKTVLNESWDVTAYWIGRDFQQQYWVVDLVSVQQCATNIPLKLPEYHYGGLGFRGLETWNNMNKIHFLTSEGETNRVKANTARARWCDISGDTGGAIGGVAILGHPDNFRAPQPMRVHPTEPFFCFAPQQMGDMEITPDKPYVSRYRLIIHDGPPVRSRLDQFWNDFAAPATVEVKYEP